MSKLEQSLNEMLTAPVEALGYEFVGVEFIRAGKNSVFRIFIDSESGIVVDDCALVSRQVSAILDVEDPIKEEYTLEVSSPGVDRPLFTIEHYQQFVGEEIKVKLKMPVNGAFNMKGKIVSVENKMITLNFAGEILTLSFDNIRKANIVAQF